MTNTKLYICAFDWHQDRWPWMTLNYKSSNFSENFSGFRIFRTQQQLNKWRQTSIVSDNVVSTSNGRTGAIFGMLSRRAGLSATAGLSCYIGFNLWSLRIKLTIMDLLGLRTGIYFGTYSSEELNELLSFDSGRHKQQKQWWASVEIWNNWSYAPPVKKILATPLWLHANLTKKPSEEANRKWPMENRMVTWPTTSWPWKVNVMTSICLGPLARQRLQIQTWLQWRRPWEDKVMTASHLHCTFRSATQPFIWCSRFSRRCAQNMELHTSSHPPIPNILFLQTSWRTTFFQPILPPSGPCNAPWFSSETLTLYNYLT